MPDNLSNDTKPPSTDVAKPPAASRAAGGFYGKVPLMTAGMTFGEYGSSGLRQFSGWVREEFLQQLVGRQGAQKYREMQDNSPVVGAMMYSINSTMRKVEWRVTPAGAEDGEPSPEAKEAAEFVETLMDDMSHTWEELVQENLSMLGYGYAPHEIVYKRRLGRTPPADPDNPGKSLPKSKYEDGLVGWRKIPLRGQDTILKWFFDRNGEILGLTQLPYVGPMVDLPIEKMLLFRPSVHKNNPEGKSVLRTAYIPYYFQKRLQEQEAIVGERMGGVPVLYIPSSVVDAAAAGDADSINAMNNYKNIVRNVRVDEQMGMVLPSDVYTGAGGMPSAAKMYEFALVTPQGRPMGGFNFQESITRYNNLILTSVLADFLTLGHEARGTQSLAISKVDMFFLAIEGFLNSVAAIYNRHALPKLWELNGFDYETMPEIEPDLAQRVDLDVLSNFIMRMAQAGMPLFPNEDLQGYILDAAGLPDVIDENALRAAGLTDDQLSVEDEKAQATLDRMQAPPAPTGQPGQPKTTPMQKMILASLARRMIKMQGPKFGVHTHVHKKRSKRRRR
jgi:hypothetical protein